MAIPTGEFQKTCDGKLCSILETSIRKDISEVKSDVKELVSSNSQLAILSTEIKYLREDLIDHRQKFENLHHSLVDLQSKSILKSDILVLIPIISFLISGVFTLLSYVTGLFGSIK